MITDRFCADLIKKNRSDPRGIPPMVVEAEIANPGSTGIRVFLNGERLCYHSYHRKKMKIDLTELLLFFDELMPDTDEEQKNYWFKTKCLNGLMITFIVSIYETRAAIIICDASETEIVGLSFKNCSEIRVLDQKRKCLEVLHDDGSKRCFLSLLENLILEYDG